MTIVGVDYGTKQIGLAIVRDGLSMVLPFGIATPATIFEKLAAEKIDTCVIGLPLAMDGGENENTKRIRTFGALLTEKTGIPVAYMDERFSSYGADMMMFDASRDEKAAMLILEQYLGKQ